MSIAGVKLTPILVMIKFLDAFLNFGQGIMTFVIFGLESQYVFAPFIRWIHKARSIWKEPYQMYADDLDEIKVPISLKFVQVIAKKKAKIFQNDLKKISQKIERTPKISDALQTPEHLMLNFCSY